MAEKTRSNSALLTLILGALQAMMPLSTDFYLPALPTIARELGVAPGAAQITVAAFFIGVATGQLVYGPITDKYGRKPPLLIGLAVYLTGTILCALAPSLAWLLAGRLVQALGASAGAVITAAIVRDLWRGKALADRLSLLFLVVGFAPIVAPSLGGLLLAHWSWRGLFWLLFFYGSLVIAAAALLPETSSPAERATVRLRDAGRAYGMLARNRPFLLYALTGGCLVGVLLAYITGAAFLYIDTLGLSPRRFALLFGLGALGFIAATQMNRVFLRRTSVATITHRAVGVALALSLLLVAVVAIGLVKLAPLFVILLALQTALGCSFPNIGALAFASVKERAGSASALQGTIQSLFGAVSAGLVGRLSNGAVLPMTIIMALFAILAVIFLVFARRLQPDC